jgi:type II secretory pathway component PulF
MAVIAVAEESGKLTDRLQWLADHHTEQADFALRALSRVLAWVIWICVAGVMVYYIFHFFLQYVSEIQRLTG